MKKSLLWCFLALFFFLSCENSPRELSAPLAFREYITNYSSGYISKDAPFQIVLAKPFDGNGLMKNVSASKLFDISPAVEGKISVSGNVLQFIPEKPLESDTEYFITCNLFRIFDIKDDKLERFTFKVHTKELKFTLIPENLQSYSRDFHFLNAYVESSDNISAEVVKKIVSARVNEKNLRVKVLSQAQKSTHIPIIVDSIPVQDFPQEIVVEWNGERADISESEGEYKLIIPARNDFSLVEVLVGEEKNSFELVFSEPLAKNQDFRGLVSVEEQTDFKFVANENSLKVYSEKDFENEVNITVHQGIRSVYGNRVERDFGRSVTFASHNPEIAFVRNGTILPSSQNLQIYFKTIATKAVEVTVYRIYENNILQFLQQNDLNQYNELNCVGAAIAKKIIPIPEKGLYSRAKWSTHALDLSSLIKPEAGAIYHIKMRLRKEFAIGKCGSSEEIQEEILPIEETDTSCYDWDDDEDYYDWDERNNACDNSYYANKIIRTNVLASDLGVIAKRGQDNSLFVAVSNLLSAKPVSGAMVEVFDFQQQSMDYAQTNREGFASFQLKKKPTFLVVTKDGNTTYLKIEDGNSLSVSNFDVSGTELQKGRNGFIYTERGVWRPGDIVSVGFIFNDFANKLPEKHPIKISLYDPFGKLVQEQVKTSTPENHYLFQFKTASEAPTGNWNCQVKVGAAVFHKNIKIETIKPNRLKIQNSLADKLIHASGERVSLQVDWLQGMPAEVPVEVTAKLYEKKTAFKGYESFDFQNNSAIFESKEVSVFKGKTNENGNTSFFFQPKEIENAKGILQVNFLTKANENGGDFSTDVATASYSPFASYVGVKAPKNNKYGFLETDKAQSFQFAVLSEDGKPLANRAVNVFIFKLNYDWWWDISYADMATYTASDSHQAVAKQRVVTDANGLALLDLKINKSDWGNYFILAEDAQSKHQAGVKAFFDFFYGNRGANASEATMLRLSTDKKKYQSNEEIALQFPSSEGGHALISVESGSKVLATYWAETEKEQTKFKIPITPEMAPNAYISVTQLQPHAQTKNDAPIRLYGITSVEVSDAKTLLEPVIVTNDVFRPEQKARIQIKEKSGKPMTYTIAIVEDGLLGLTRFKTPRPWDTFFAKMALGVKTWDMYNDVIGAFGGTINQVFSIGGDEALYGANAQKANRFQPLAIVKGPFHSNGGTETHEIQLPNYIGSARIMVVASNVSENAFGNAEKSIPVRSPLMVLGSLPRKAAPSEAITLPVTLFAMEKQIKNVSVRVKTSSHFSAEGEKEKQFYFENPSEKMGYFQLKVLESGIGKVTIEATSGAEKASYEVEMDIFNPNPLTHQVQHIVLEQNASETLDYSIFGEAGSNVATLEVSSFMGVNLNQRIKELIEYPHGCGEQVTSGAFPQLFLKDFAPLTQKQQTEIQQNVTNAITKLSENQLTNGGFSYWKGENQADEWVSSYIGQFYIEAEKQGFVLPNGSKMKWLDFQKKQARSWTNAHPPLTQAYRLYTLALASQPDIASMNRLRETGNLSNEVKRLLAASYALAGQKSTAENLFNTTSVDDSDVSTHRYSYGSPTRSQAMALETALLIGNQQVASKLAFSIAEKLSSADWLSTQTAAYSLYAMAKFVKQHKSGKHFSLSYSDDTQKGNLKSEIGFASQSLEPKSGKHSLKLKNTSEQTLYARVISSGRLPIGNEITQQQGLSLTTRFTDAKGNAINETEIKQGTTFFVTISVTNITQMRVENVALTQCLASGWEVVNTRFTDFGSDSKTMDYTDIRDDKAMYYFSLNAGETKSFRLQLNASYAGKYYLSGTHAEAMYDNHYNTRTSGKWVQVK